uniref:PDZ domain-containing protein n=1 Tax=Anopheles atroparvus TaxID=41427 RepID=A0A182IZY0_ANOAO
MGRIIIVEPKRARRKISPLAMHSLSPTASSEELPANVTIIQVSNSSVASTPSPTVTTSPKPVSRFIFTKATKPTTISSPVAIAPDDGGGDISSLVTDHNYRSNVQIIPSNVEYERQQPAGHQTGGAVEDHLRQPSIIASINEQQITTVTVPNVPKAVPLSTLKTVPAPAPTVQVAVATSSTPIKGPENNFGTVTQIAVNSGPNQPPQQQQQQQQHYEQVFLSTSLTPSSVLVTTTSIGGGRGGASSTEQQLVSVTPVGAKPMAGNKSSKVLLLSKQPRSSSHSEIALPGRAASKGGSDKENHVQHHPAGVIPGVTASSSKQMHQQQQQGGVQPSASSPAVPMHLTGGSPSKRPAVDRNIYTPHPQRAPLLQRGLTELVLSTRSSPSVATGSEQPAVNGGGRSRRPPVENKMIRNDPLPPEQRRRSSSTSDARQEHPTARTNGATGAPAAAGPIGRLQSPPQPFRPHHQLMNVPEGGGGATGPIGAGGNRKLTLREQQVFQLRREMMHPGGVRLQLRRKDCINSIGLVDAFGAVWVAGWKQKEHPVLYNALHIGDQLISVAGVAIASSTEAHKAIRAAPGLFVELIIRRIPFGRVYAIRREIDGQCLGLIRDGNTSTIVDVVPNSLAARHGLPPKAKSCDGLSLTFWVLTEINGRPLNLFFKENEIRDRLNAVGRDISILVQPADLVTKLKKQLKSLRGHKDFIVQ